MLGFFLQKKKKNYFFLFARTRTLTLTRQTQHLKFINWSHRRIFTFYYFKGSKKLYRVQIFIYIYIFDIVKKVKKKKKKKKTTMTTKKRCEVTNEPHANSKRISLYDKRLVIIVARLLKIRDKRRSSMCVCLCRCACVCTFVRNSRLLTYSLVVICLFPFCFGCISCMRYMH